MTGENMSLRYVFISDWSKYDRPSKFSIHGSFVTGQNIENFYFKVKAS